METFHLIRTQTPRFMDVDFFIRESDPTIAYETLAELINGTAYTRPPAG